MQRKLPAVLLGLALLATIAAGGSLAQPASPARVEVHGPLGQFNMTNCFYRDMNITLSMWLTNWLSPSSPPACPSLAPVDAYLTCSCSMEPREWWSRNWSVVLGPGEEWSSTLATTVPGWAALGNASAGFGCVCSWAEWCTTVTTSYSYTTSTTTTTKCAEAPPCEGYCTPVNETWTCCICTRYITSTTTTTTIATTTSTATARVSALENIMVLPRSVNQSLLGLDMNVSLLKAYPNGTALVNITVMLFNFGLGLCNSTLPTERGMLLLHNLSIYVDGKEAIRCGGYCAPAEKLPVNDTPMPSASGSVVLTLTPRKPGSEYGFDITICYTEDANSTPTRTCVSDNVTVPLPFGWRKTVYIADDCRAVSEAWEIVPANETGVHVKLVEDNVKPSLTARDYCIAASAGACEPVRLEVYENGSMVASRTGQGSITWCPLKPRAYTVVAVDAFNNTVTGTFNLTWTAGPPPAIKRALLGLAASLLALMVALYIILEGRWPLRGL